MKRIVCILESNPYYSTSPSANRWIGLIEGLIKEGAEVKLLFYGAYQSEKEASEWQEKGIKNKIHYKYIRPKPIKGYIKARYHKYIGVRFKEKRLMQIIGNKLKGTKDIIWTDSTLFGFKLAVYLRKKDENQKLFLELSEFLDIHHFNDGYFIERWLGNYRQKYFEKKAFFAYNGLALMTQTLMEHYEKFSKIGPKLLHLPMTVDLERFQGDINVPAAFVKPYIAFVGVMGNAKDGVNILIDAFNEIANDYPDLRLYLVGGWNYDTPGHLKQITQLNLTDRIKWVGSYPREVIPAILNNAQLLALPRPDSKQAQGGFPTKLGEYLATGNPVCATKVGEIPDYLVDDESVFFAEPGSVNSFAEVLRKALTNSSQAEQIGKKGLEVAQKYFNKDIQSKLLYHFLSQIQHENSK